MSLAICYCQHFDCDIWEFLTHSLKKKEEKKLQKGVGRIEQEVEKNGK